jgi:hypothetical protein
METLIEWLPRIGAIIMLIIGLVGFFKPRLFTENLGIQMNSALAVSEMRTVMGGLNIGLAVGALALQEPLVYITLGLAWLFGLLARFYSMLADKSGLKESIPAFVVDGGLAFLFLSNLFL